MTNLVMSTKRKKESNRSSGASQSAVVLGVLVALIVVAAAYFLFSSHDTLPGGEPTGDNQVVYGISPYQDTIIPQYAELLGWYEEDQLDIDLRVLAWGDVMPSLGGGAVDVAIQNFNSFQATYWNLRDRGVDPVFYYPLYVFKGAAIIIPADSPLKTVEQLESQGLGLDEAVRAAAEQLKGLEIAATEGTEMEQVVIAALNRAGLERDDAVLIHAQPDEALAAFLGGSIDAFSAGVTEHTEAARHEARVLLSASHVLPPVIDGLVTTREFAADHEELLDQLVDMWFRSVQHLAEDLPGRSPILLEFLNGIASTKYSVEEYEFVWNNLQFFPTSQEEAQAALLSPAGQYYWRTSWDENNEFLQKEGKIPESVPLDAFGPSARLRP